MCQQKNYDNTLDYDLVLYNYVECDLDYDINQVLAIRDRESTERSSFASDETDYSILPNVDDDETNRRIRPPGKSIVCAEKW